MDPGTLAAGVTAAVLWVLKQGGARIVDRATDAAVDEMWERLRPLYELLREHVVPGSAAAAALDAARRDPGDPTVEPALRQHLRALLAEEPSLALELTSRLAQAGTVTVEGNTAYIEIHAPVTNSVIIGGTVNQAVDIRIELPRTLDQPRQLKAPTRGFVGRRADGRRALHELQPRARGVPVVMVTGPPGIGKTEFAYWVASAVRDQGRSGVQLMVRLSAGGASPRAAEDALVELLLALGVPLDEVPPGEPARQARYAAMLEGRRPLILLDDAVDARQVEALLPPSGGMVIVTSRRELRELLADRATAIRLKPLTTPQALQLLAQRIGWGRVGGCGSLASSRP
jgi:hypothetical protein